jgi:hypothetical protein
MAIILQELVGQDHRGKFYPNISGVAQSYNFYPFAYMQPDDGFAVIALGLGAYVVGGEKAWRFCPRYPKLQLAALHDQIRDSQRYFYAVTCSGKTAISKPAAKWPPSGNIPSRTWRATETCASALRCMTA